jgi:hypothetical protein
LNRLMAVRINSSEKRLRNIHAMIGLGVQDLHVLGNGEWQ